MKIRSFVAEFRADGLAVGQTHRHDEANSGFSQYCEHASKHIFYLCWNFLRYRRFATFGNVWTRNWRESRV